MQANQVPSKVVACRLPLGEAEHLWASLPEDRRRQVRVVLEAWLERVVCDSREEAAHAEPGEGDR
jgi:hypothetical protein